MDEETRQEILNEHKNHDLKAFFERDPLTPEALKEASLPKKRKGRSLMKAAKPKKT